jgi:hypothetical protein
MRREIEVLPKIQNRIREELVLRHLVDVDVLIYTIRILWLMEIELKVIRSRTRVWNRRHQVICIDTLDLVRHCL